MKPEDRQSRIVEIVHSKGEASVETLAELFGVSLETVRRDLQALASTGALHKVRGGARPIRRTTEGSFRDRMFVQSEAKAEIGRKMAAMVEDGQTLFLDTGTTTLACAEALRDRHGLTVVTNSTRIAEILGLGGGHQVYLLGGRYAADNFETVGAMAIDQIECFEADRAVITVAALASDAGAMDADVDEAQMARAMIRRARHTAILADSTKFGRSAAHRVCRLREIDVLVSDGQPGGALGEALDDAGVEVR